MDPRCGTGFRDPSACAPALAAKRKPVANDRAHEANDRSQNNDVTNHGDRHAGCVFAPGVARSGHERFPRHALNRTTRTQRIVDLGETIGFRQQ